MGNGEGSGSSEGAAMSLPVVLRDEAQREFDEAFDWYESRRPGLGIEFVGEVQRVLDRIAVNPLIHSAVQLDIRKSVVRRFPYAVFYRPHADRIEVIAVFHSKRDPANLHDRV
jgi:plasmid stabilization system protein ParE